MKRAPCKPLTRQRGSALLLAIWALLLLSALVLTWLEFISAEVELTRTANFALDAEALAHSGVEIALHPGVTPRTPILAHEFAPGRGYSVTMNGEGGRLNINWLLAGENPVKLNILKNYLALHKLDFQQRETLVDQLLDYTDQDNTRRVNGLETAPGYRAPNRPIQNVEEIAQIPAADPLLRSSGWRNDLTVLSQGPIDLAYAPAHLLALIPGVGESGAISFVQIRNGDDGKLNTDDDFLFEDIQEASSYLGLTAEQFDAVQWLVSFNDPTYHISSVGTVSDVNREIEVVARKAGTSSTIFLWQQF
jgi:type II secretory pathway component PulK